MEDNNRASTRVHRMEDDKWESTHVHTQWRTTNGNQCMSIHNGGQQMGINPCLPNSFYWEYTATKQWAKDGGRLTKLVGTGLTKL